VLSLTAAFPVPRLQVLRLAGNKLKALPPYMAKLTNLHELFLGGNELQELFPGIYKCTHLARLGIESNLFPCLPYELARITSLTSIGM